MKNPSTQFHTSRPNKPKSRDEATLHNLTMPDESDH